MIVRWSAVQTAPNDIAEEDGRLCECGKRVPNEYLELYAISDGRLLEVKRVQTHGNMVRITVDA